MNKFKNYGKFDRYNSTYQHRIFFKDGHYMEGYSKGMQTTEKPDKIQVLEDTISRLHSKYLNPANVHCMEFWYNPHNELVTARHGTAHLFNLYPDWWEPKHEAFVAHPLFSPFLERLYNMRRAGKMVTAELKDKFKRSTEDSIFSLSFRRFKSKESLQKYCAKMVSDGYEQARVTSFYYAYLDKYYAPEQVMLVPIGTKI